MSASCGFFAAIAALFTMSPCDDEISGLLHFEKSLYRNIYVIENDDLRCLTFRKSIYQDRQTCVSLDDPDELVFPYTRMMLGVLSMNPNPERILIVGLGGGTLPMDLQEILPRAHIDVVEIDEAVVKVARDYFDYQEDGRLRTFAMDGRVFVKRALLDGNKYDLIMLDAFEDEYIPEHLLTVEFLNEVKDLLSPSGIVASNTFSSSGLYPHESATYEEAFGTFYNLRSTNRVIWAKKGELPPKDEITKNANELAPEFEKRGFRARWLIDLVSIKRDWPSDSYVLTDQYSPSNILNER